MGSAIPLCRWPLPRLCGFPSTGCRRRRLSFQLRPLFELVLSFRVLPGCTYPAATASAVTARPSHGLPVPTAHEGIRGPLPAGLPACYVPPSGFGYPLDGLLPRIPRRFSFTPAALMGFTLRRFPHSAGLPAFPPAATHLPLARRLFRRRSNESLPTSIGFWVRSCQESLATAQRFRPTVAGASLGFCPSKACHEDLSQDFSRPPLTRFAKPWRLLAELAGVSECRSASAPPCPTTHQSAPAGQGNPSGVPAPARS